MAGDYGEFVEDEEVRRRCGGDVDNVQVRRRVVKWVEMLLGSWCGRFELWERFLCERRAEPKLELRED